MYEAVSAKAAPFRLQPPFQFKHNLFFFFFFWYIGRIEYYEIVCTIVKTTMVTTITMVVVNRIIGIQNGVLLMRIGIHIQTKITIIMDKTGIQMSIIQSIFFFSFFSQIIDLCLSVLSRSLTSSKF